MIDRYLRAVALCNNLALLTSHGTMKEFVLRFAVLAQLQRFWNDGQSYVKVVICSEEEAESAARSEETVALAAVPEHEDSNGHIESDAASDSTVDLKPMLPEHAEVTDAAPANKLDSMYS